MECQFVKELNLKQEAYYYTETRIYLKRKLVADPILYHSFQKPTFVDRMDGGMLIKCTKQKEGETIAKLKERAYKEALEEIKNAFWGINPYPITDVKEETSIA